MDAAAKFDTALDSLKKAIEDLKDDVAGHTKKCAAYLKEADLLKKQLEKYDYPGKPRFSRSATILANAAFNDLDRAGQDMTTAKSAVLKEDV